MPITSSAKKAMRQDRKRAVVNRPLKSRVRAAIIEARKNPSQETVRQAHSTLDKAAKKHIIKKGKADRLKSRLVALLAKEKSPQPTTSNSKKAKPSTGKKKTAPRKTAAKSKKKA